MDFPLKPPQAAILTKSIDSTPEDISDPNTPADQTDSTGQEAQAGEKNSVLPVAAVVAAVLLGGGAFYFIKRRR